ncbi:nuclear transport factor 2 family protein [Hyphomonas adhaerens]|uniref:nuclear transport factor 2 family protein n=1 Tax=Hyphomonas adhaerens TaxID=81029 RepID=UPI00235491EE|nr:nuclear transport factor 2 family protein [Hyphomonas adhaerens]
MIMTNLFRRGMALISAGAILLLSACASYPADDTPEGGPQVLMAYVDAFNARDIDALGNLIHPDIEWWSITDDGAELVFMGRDTLTDNMEDYFDEADAVTTELSGWAIAGPYVSANETVRWTDEDGVQRSQAALVIYELSGDDQVRRVWYYPAVDAE